jgi:hypothetical protein
MNIIDKFYEHLDACEQCRNHPFDLCLTGDKLLIKAATTLTDDMQVKMMDSLYKKKDKNAT